jgi:hypothetical protein
MWASFGLEEPPDPAHLEEALDPFLEGSRRATAELARLEEAEARTAARAVVRRPLVVLRPSSWISQGRLGQLLSSLPPEGRAVVVEPAPEHDLGPAPARSSPAAESPG